MIVFAWNQIKKDFLDIVEELRESVILQEKEMQYRVEATHVIHHHPLSLELIHPIKFMELIIISAFLMMF